MAVVIAGLRGIQDRRHTTVGMVLVETLLCGVLTLSAGSAIEAMGYGPGWWLFCGGVIGSVGSQSVRAAIGRIFRKNTK